MARIALSVSSDYLPGWGAYEGLRELVQNFIDSQDDSGVKGEIRFEGGSARGTVRLVNPGAKPLTREALLFGVTSKADRADQRGQFGEGMKVGTLALVRAGRSVTIRTQEETWSASLQASPDFGGRKVLTFDTRKRSRGTDQVEVEIGPVSREEWDQIGAAFLFMQERDNVSECDYGSMLTGADHLSTVFAKGILVKKIEGMRYGYDLSQITLNRDRSMIDEYDVRSHVVLLLSEQYKLGKIDLDILIGMFRDNTWETAYGYAWAHSDVTPAMIKKLTCASGPKSVITSSNEEATRIESYGWNAIRVTPPMMEAMNSYLKSDYSEYVKFRKDIGLTTYKELVELMRDAVGETFARSDLDSSESANLTWAITTLASVKVNVAPTVCKFVRDGELIGLFQGGKIWIARSQLACKHDTLATLIHEYSHNFGGDASLEHTASIENIWTRVSRSIIG
jgi:hypothetical protein